VGPTGANSVPSGYAGAANSSRVVGPGVWQVQVPTINARHLLAHWIWLHHRSWSSWWDGLSPWN